MRVRYVLPGATVKIKGVEGRVTSIAGVTADIAEPLLTVRVETKGGTPLEFEVHPDYDVAIVSGPPRGRK